MKQHGLVKAIIGVSLSLMTLGVSADPLLEQAKKLEARGQGLTKSVGLTKPVGEGEIKKAIQQTEDTVLIERLHTIERQAKSCSEAVKNLLDSSKKPDLIIQSVDLVSFLDKLINTMIPIARQKSNMRLQFNHPHSAFGKIDPVSFEQIIFNLISNSMEACATEMVFNLDHNEDNTYWQLQVSDNGEGIDSSTQSQVFDAFFSTKHTNEESNSGTGLGLYLNKTLLQQMNGEIKIQKSNQNGTIFLLQVPLDA